MLNFYITIKQTFSDYGIKDGYILVLLPEFRGGAGFGLCTIDVEKNNTKL